MICDVNSLLLRIEQHPASSNFVPTTKEINMERGFDHIKTSGYLMFQGNFSKLNHLKTKDVSLNRIEHENLRCDTNLVINGLPLVLDNSRVIHFFVSN